MAKKKKMRSLSDLGGLVYSTNSDQELSLNEDALAETLRANQQKLYVSLDRKQRKGKVVTLIEGFEGKEEDLLKLGKKLKTSCGCGGSVKEGVILIQGNFKDKIYSILTDDGYHVKKKG